MALILKSFDCYFFLILLVFIVFIFFIKLIQKLEVKKLVLFSISVILFLSKKVIIFFRIKCWGSHLAATKSVYSYKISISEQNVAVSFTL